METLFSVISWGLMIGFLLFVASRAHIMQNNRIKEREEIIERVKRRREEEAKAKEESEKEEVKK